jgi:hypothetical protein
MHRGPDQPPPLSSQVCIPGRFHCYANLYSHVFYGEALEYIIQEHARNVLGKMPMLVASTDYQAEVGLKVAATKKILHKNSMILSIYLLV